jgi:hypothetical protein
MFMDGMRVRVRNGMPAFLSKSSWQSP